MNRLQLLSAIERDDVQSVQVLIEEYSIDINALIGDADGAPPIVLAARNGSHAIAELLLNAGANVNGVDAREHTACHFAAQNGDIALLELLHARGADLNADDFHGETPLCLAARECEDECAKRLVELGASLERISVQFALASAGTTFIQMLIDAGIDVGEICHPSWGTPLHWASYDDDEGATMDMLVNVCGVDMNAVNDDGNNCCHNAVLNGSVHALRWLIDAGADFDVANRIGDETPLHLTADRTDSDVDVKCMCLLLAAGANVHAKCDDGSTALHFAAKTFELPQVAEAVHLLLAAGADLDAMNSHGVTPRQVLSERDDVIEIDSAKIEAARRRIAATRLDFVRNRAIQVCIGLQSLRLDALQMCEILQFSCGRMAAVVAFHQWWAIATTAKHFKSEQ